MSRPAKISDADLYAMLSRANGAEPYDGVLVSGIECALGKRDRAAQPNASGWWGQARWRDHLAGVETE